jgi:PAS domain S-box-containing protein
MAERKKDALKSIIRKLHDGADPHVVKQEFSEFLQGTTATEISQAEEELIKEGMPAEEIHRLCDIHLAIFKESLEGQTILAPPGHPVNILMEEHRILLTTAEELFMLLEALRDADLQILETKSPRVRHLIHHLKDSEKHYHREENVLFPYLEKHGVTQPPAIMWMEHDQIRETEKQLYNMISENEKELMNNLDKIIELAASLNELLSGHFYKENNILFPTALNVIENSEWITVRQEFDEIGYCCFTPTMPEMGLAIEEQLSTEEIVPENMISFETGDIPKVALEAMLDTLPVDITFVDSEDRVRYFSNSPERIFVRSKAVIGRSVQNCHPQKSVHVVNQILNDFRDNKRDKAEFWINLKGQIIYIRYFAVRDKKGKYLGCLEVSQDITEIKKIEGEKRLLDELHQ